MSDELKPCPFCGGEAVLDTGFADYVFIVRCTKCFARTDSFIMSIDDVPDDELAAQSLAVEAWNRRDNDD